MQVGTPMQARILKQHVVQVVPLYALIKYVGTDVDRKLVKAALNKQARREAAQRRGAANDSGVRVGKHTHTLSGGGALPPHS